MIRPPLFSEVAARHGLRLRNCDSGLGRLRYCADVLLLGCVEAPWREFLLRATIDAVASTDWPGFARSHRRCFDLIVVGDWLLPPTTTVALLRANGFTCCLDCDHLIPRDYQCDPHSYSCSCCP